MGVLPNKAGCGGDRPRLDALAQFELELTSTVLTVLRNIDGYRFGRVHRVPGVTGRTSRAGRHGSRRKEGSPMAEGGGPVEGGGLRQVTVVST